MKDVKMKQLMDLAEKLDDYVSNQPYQINVLAETHMCDYVHTRIITGFLKYPPILHSFLRQLPGWEFNIDKPDISFPHNHYDILIMEPKKYAVAIVNNVFGSVPDYETIVTNLNKDIDNWAPEGSIWLAILNKDDTKSCATENSKDLHTMNWSYRKEYLSWLRSLKVGDIETPLNSAITQYINYLEVEMGLNEQTLKQQMASFVLNVLGYNPYDKVSETYNLLDKAYCLLSVIPIAQKIMKDAIKRSFYDNQNQILSRKFPNIGVHQEDGTEWRYYRIRMRGWPTYIYMQWEYFTWESLLRKCKLSLALKICQNDTGFWSHLAECGCATLFDNGSLEHTEFLTEAYCDMKEDERETILARFYETFHPVIAAINETL